MNKVLQPQEMEANEKMLKTVANMKSCQLTPQTGIPPDL